MSAASHATEKHGHDDGAVHAHVSPIGLYIAIFLGLLALTVATVAQSYVNLGELNIIFVILIATMKASLVTTFFMHLKWDNKFNSFILIGSFFFIGLFFVFTMNDTNRRGDLDPDQNVKYLPQTGLEAPGGGPPTIPTGAPGVRELGAAMPAASASAEGASPTEH